MTDTPLPAREPRRRRRDRRSNGGSPTRRWLKLAAVALLGLAVVGAPLACGAVHRPVLLPLLGVVAALALVTAALVKTGSTDLRPWPAVALPLLFLLIAAAQIIPVPGALRSFLDPKGSELLTLAHLTGAQPMSLDPPETYLRFAEAAAALAVTLAAVVLAASRRLRFVVPGLVASTGLTALVIGLGHRAVAESKIYGLFASGRGLLLGPFINPNHTAEFLELSAFAALAFAYARGSLGERRLWKIVAAALAAGALACLSRGSLLALGGGGLTWFLLAPKSEEGEPFHRSKLAALLIGALLVCGIAFSFGAERIIGALAATRGEGLTKVSVWFDALAIVPHHPAGIGLGAFGRVYPVYQSLPSLYWFQFVEDQPIAILIETGVPGTLVLLGGLAVTILHAIKRARRDRVEASLIAGLVVVLVHNLTDFGLETPGILLPFCALVGTMFGRQVIVPEQSASKPRIVAASVVTGLLVFIGMGLLHSPACRDFDALLWRTSGDNTGDVARATARAASLAHPTDFIYALAEARVASTDLASTGGRLRSLNRAILLCPQCPTPHAEAARELWRLGRRKQALLEWRTALARRPSLLAAVLAELVGAGANPDDLATLGNDQNRLDLCYRLLGLGMIDAARGVLLDSAKHEGLGFHVAEASIALAANDLRSAREAARRALEDKPRDPLAFAVSAEVEARAKDRERALQLLSDGLRFEPTNPELNRRRLYLLMETDRWLAIDQALADFRRSLSEAGSPMSEANLAAAAIYERRGQYQRSLAEYQAAAALSPDDLGLLLAVARAAERAGSISVAIDAYAAVLRRAPDQADARAGLARIHHVKKTLDAFGGLPSHTGRRDK